MSNDPELVFDSGHRLWIWSADSPSVFETELTDVLKQYVEPESSESIFFLSAFSSRANFSTLRNICRSHLPSKLELPNERTVCIFNVSEEREFSIPATVLSYSVNDENQGIANILVSSNKHKLSNQLILIFASRLKDYHRTDQKADGHDDIVGYFTLALGDVIVRKSLFESYFCIRRQKFITANIKAATVPQTHNFLINIKSMIMNDNLDLQDEVSQLTIWFLGRSFREQSVTSRLVYLNTALEIAAGRSPLNVFRQIYCPSDETINFANEILAKFKKARHELLHHGKHFNLDETTERLVQALIFDALLHRSKNLAGKPAFISMLEALHNEEG